ncbi:hypothetical protein ACFFU9_05930 [Mariniflexile ostreae]|uniref:TonB-like protein n=1 Tax=Mariniflexile ostreae TaxID=1520892 RepID=A0ABV5FA68_9FLAO
MKQICIFILITMLSSCEYFKVKKTSSETILNEELQTFKWNEVDTYPTFSTCDSVSSKLEKDHCFETILTHHIHSYLLNETIIVSQDIDDTIILDFQVSKDGTLTLLNSKIDSVTLQEIPNIKSLLRSSLDSLPEVFPAIKRGQHVNTQFKLPIIIKVN